MKSHVQSTIEKPKNHKFFEKKWNWLPCLQFWNSKFNVFPSSQILNAYGIFLQCTKPDGFTPTTVVLVLIFQIALGSRNFWVSTIWAVFLKLVSFQFSAQFFLKKNLVKEQFDSVILSKVSLKLVRKMPFCKNRVKTQFMNKLRLIFYFIVPKFQLKLTIKMALLVSYFWKLLKTVEQFH